MTAAEIANRIALLFNPQPDMSGQQINRLHGGRRRHVEDLASDIMRVIAAAERERDEYEQQIEAMDEKLRSLAPHGSCACSYDRPGDVCMHHSPALAAARAENERLRSAQPTPKMVEAGVEARWRSPVRDADSVREIWAAMHAAALADQGGGDGV